MLDFETALRAMPSAIQPLYETAAVNSPIDLYTGSLTLRPHDGGSPVTGCVFLRWLPKPQATFELTDAGLIPKLDDDSPLWIDGLSTSCRVATTSAVLIEGRYSGRLLSDPPRPGKQVDQVTFHLPNFHPYVGEAIRHEGQGASCGRMVLKHGPWRITLDQVLGAIELRTTLEAEGGFAITNVGRIERSDGRPFTKSKCRDLLKALFFFTSFCRGIWCGPMLAVGTLGQDTNCLHWVPPRITGWCVRQTWWPELEPLLGTEISRAFSGFMTLWNRPLWRDPLMNAVHWYVEANSNAGGLEGGLILTQTALELLSWLVAVEDPKTARFTEQQFNNNRTFPAEIRVRHLLEILAIPVQVPSGLSHLVKALPHLQSPDGVGAIVGIRNALIHPRKARRTALAQTNVRARVDALTLGLWFLEVALLRLFRYTGLYYSRLRSGTNAEVRVAMPK